MTFYVISVIKLKYDSQSWGYSSVVKELTNRHKTLGSIRSTANIKKRVYVSVTCTHVLLAGRNKAKANSCSKGTACWW